MSGASEPALIERPAARRPFFWRSHGAFLLLLAVALPLTVAFSWQEVIASLGDDSVSYFALARQLSPFSSDPLLAPWTKYHGHFPPLFPLLLVLTGGAQNLLVAHLAVGACALAALLLVYRYASLRLGSTGAGFLVALLFLLSPTAWISIRGILSEPLYLALSLAALIFHDRRVREGGGKAALLAFGFLLAAAYLTRVAGVALVLAYGVHVAVGAMARRQRPAAATFLPLVPVLVLAGLWLAMRPHPDVDNYQLTMHGVVERWLYEPGALLVISWDSLFGGWVASFTGDSGVGSAMRLSFGALGFIGVAGALLGAARNRLDAWYVLASLAMLFVWVFPEDNTRRLLYPLVPLLLVHAAEALAAACARLQALRYRRRALLAGWALLVVMVMPASLLVLQKSLDRTPLVAGFAYSNSSITEYYTTVNLKLARSIAGQHAAVLAGLESIDRATPPGARVMWMRPEYVALLGKRAAVAWYFAWDRPTLAREIRRSGVDYFVIAELFKSDLTGRKGDAFTSLVREPLPYLHPTLIIASPDDGKLQFMLFEVDRAALDLYLAKGA